MTTHLVLAADVGGTQMRAALVGPRGDVLLRRIAATPAHADVPGALIDLIRDVGAERGHGTVSHAVVGLPGGVDYETGRLMWAPHLPEGWPDRLSRDELTAQLGMPAHIANDADLAAVGEAAFGAGTGTADVAYLTISTGIGAGVVLRRPPAAGAAVAGRGRSHRHRLACVAGGVALHARGAGVGQWSGAHRRRVRARRTRRA